MDFGALEGTRTPDPLLRRQLLYPPELQAHRIRNILHYITMVLVLQQEFFKNSKIFLENREDFQKNRKKVLRMQKNLLTIALCDIIITRL